MVSRFHLLCLFHKLTGCNLKFNMKKKVYDTGWCLVFDKILHNPSYKTLSCGLILHGQVGCELSH